MGITIEERRKKAKNEWNRDFYSDPVNKELHNQQMKEYYQKNKKKMILKARKYKKDNREDIKTRNKKYYEKNKEHLQIKSRAYAKKKALELKKSKTKK